MPKVTHVKKARKANRAYGIKKGESYYWWKFRFGPKCVSKTYPKRQQLTRSDFYIGLYDLEDRIADLEPNDSLADEVSSIIEDIRALAEEQGEKKDNMPEGLQEGDTGQLLEERQSELESWADELEGIDLEIDENEIKDAVLSELGYGTVEEIDEDYKDEFNERVQQKTSESYQEKVDELQGCSHNL